MDAVPPSQPGPGTPEMEESGRSRRHFLELAVGLFTSLIGMALAVPFLGTIIGSSYRARKELYSKAMALGGLPIGRPVDVAYQEMAPDGFLRSRTVRHVWVVKRSENEVTVFSPVCPHLGCRYDWDPRDSLFKCPCHASVFRLDGTVVSGPAPRPLDTLPAEIQGGVLSVEWQQFEVGVPEKKQV